MKMLAVEQSNFSLIAVRSQVSAGFGSLKELVQSLNTCGELISISGIYRKLGVAGVPESDLWVVIKLESPLPEDQLSVQLQELENQKGSTTLGQYIVLSFNETVRLAPPNPLPHPMLQDEPVILTCASESWGQYKHPILKKTLNELFTNLMNREPLEFYAQGKTLL